MSTSVQPTSTPVASQNASDATAAPASQTTTGTAQPTGSLYVGDLSEYVAESHLFDYFNMIGPVASIRVCRDANTRRSLGYAYVNYHNVSDAERAIEALNYTPIQGKICRIMWSQRDPSLRKIGTGNVFIKNLDPSIDNKALHDTFTAFGKILSCKVVTENGKSKGYGFVHFDKYDDAEAAIQNVNGMLLNDLIVYVGHHQSSKERASKADEAKKIFTNVYVKNIDPSVTDDQLNELFSQQGPVTSALVSRTEDGKSKEFGFVNFENHEDAMKAIENLHEHELAGKKIFVCRAQKKNEREQELRKQFEQFKEDKAAKSQGVNLYVKNLDDNIDDEKLREAFTPYGTITSCKVMSDDKKVSKGFGFVAFSTTEEASKALAEMNNRMLGNKPLYVGYAQRKDERRAILEAQRSTRIPSGIPAPMYPNTAIFYPPNPAYPPQGQRGMVYGQPGMMAPRNRWNGQQQIQGQYVPNGVGAAPHAYAQGRAPRQPRQNPPRTNTTNRQPFPNNAIQSPTQAQAPVEDGQAAASGLTAAALASASPEEQKQMIGEQLFPLIFAHNEEHAGKITGMLLEMDNDELLHLIDSPEALEQKVSEALSVLEQHA
ncbi:polyadenylate binding protein [Neoconidiobolus thromboides FSU 785]|nr:polyadenylate binding protein [Neoconidiobolus thromboides FSU 785]